MLGCCAIASDKTASSLSVTCCGSERSLLTMLDISPAGMPTRVTLPTSSAVSGSDEYDAGLSTTDNAVLVSTTGLAGATGGVY